MTVIRTSFRTARRGRTVAGELLRPDDGAARHPAVLLSHGFGSNRHVNDDYAEALAENGFAVVNFDFRGGGPESASGGSMLDMSVLTEAADLEAVLDDVLEAAWSLPGVFLMGSSQGGFVDTVVAAARSADIRGMVLLYPAYSLQAGMRDAPQTDPSELPDTFQVGPYTVGKRYVLDAASFDVYDCARAYPGPVLILQGESDSVVPPVFAERAVQAFPSARLIRFPGAGHGFTGADRTRAASESVSFFRSLLREER